jgi:hypothetical protein
VTPDVTTTIADPGDYDPADPAKVAYEQKQSALLHSILGPDKPCRTH